MTKLNNGHSLPLVGLGTYSLKGQICIDAVYGAIRLGYRLSSVFVASHAVSRHRSCEDIAFKLDANAVPMDAVADRQLQVELERQLNESKLREMLLTAVPEDGSPVKRSVAAELLEQNYPIKRAKAYNLLKDFVKRGWLIEVDRITVRLNTQYRRIDEQTNMRGPA